MCACMLFSWVFLTVLTFEARVWNFTMVFIKFHFMGSGLLFPTAKIILKHNSLIYHINYPSFQLSAIFKFDKPNFYTFIQVTNKNVEHLWENLVDPLVNSLNWHKSTDQLCLGGILLNCDYIWNIMQLLGTQALLSEQTPQILTPPQPNYRTLGELPDESLLSFLTCKMG